LFLKRKTILKILKNKPIYINGFENDLIIIIESWFNILFFVWILKGNSFKELKFLYKIKIN